jgi:YbgC/YbaW family acyl-CoA thioester hydrolase
MKSIELKRRIRWADVDASGRIYFARIFDYAGEGEWELLHSTGASRKELAARGYDFPRVHADCDFHKPIRLGSTITLRFGPRKLGRTSIHYEFTVFLDDEPNEPAAVGHVTVVVLHNGKPSDIPPELRLGYTG